MPVPRRFDRRPPERDTTRINERIRVPKVRLIGADGEQVGIIDIDDALKRAQDATLAARPYSEKLDEVYQWRNGVFSRSRDAAKLKPLSKQAFEQMGLTPEQGGMVMGYRLVPYLFGYESLPAVRPVISATQP